MQTVKYVSLFEAKVRSRYGVKLCRLFAKILNVVFDKHVHQAALRELLAEARD